MEQKPPKLPSMADLLLQMTGCRVSTNTNGGNPNGNDKHKISAIVAPSKRIVDVVAL